MKKLSNVNEAKVLTIGVHDAVVGDDLIMNITSKIVFIPADADPTSTEPDYLSEYPSGTFAVPYGGAAVYQKNGAGEWVVFGQQESPEEEVEE